MALFRILKHVEGMAQQLHLQNGFLHAHGLDGKPLYPNDLALFLLPILSGGIDRLCPEGALPQVLFQLGAMPYDLVL